MKKSILTAFTGAIMMGLALFTTDAVAATTCKAGEYKGGSKCLECPAGYYCKDEVRKACPAGKYQDQWGQSECKSCPANSYTDVAGSTTYKKCTGANQIVNAKHTACEACKTGYIPNSDHTACEEVICKAGEYKSGNKCLECPAGSYCKDGVRKACPAGKYQDQRGQSECKECVLNSYTDVAGSTTYKKCTGANQIVNAKHTACESCKTGQQPNADHTKCENKCPFTLDKDGKSCLYLENFKTRSCGAGKYNLVALGWYNYTEDMLTYQQFVAKNCLACPKNATCNGKDFTCKAGFDRIAEHDRRECVCPTPKKTCTNGEPTGAMNGTTGCVTEETFKCANNEVCNTKTGMCETVTDCSKRPQVGESCVGSSCAYEGLICDNGKWTAIGNCNPGYETECSVCNAKTYNMENKPDGTQCHADIGYCQAGQCVTCPSHAYYDVKNGTCVCTDKGAVFDKDAWVCASPTNVSCSSDFDCPKNTPICDKTTGQCVARCDESINTDGGWNLQMDGGWNPCKKCNTQTGRWEDVATDTKVRDDAYRLGYCRNGEFYLVCDSIKTDECHYCDDRTGEVVAIPDGTECGGGKTCQTGQCVATVEPECHTDLDCSIQDSMEWQCNEEGYCKQVRLMVMQSCINNRCTVSQECESGARLNGKCVKSDCLISCPEKSSDELWTIARMCIDKGRADCGVQTQQCPDDQEWNKEEQRCLCKSPFPLPPDGKCLQSWDDVKEIACNRKKFNVVASGWGSLSTGNKVPWDTFYERLCHDCLENATCDGTHITCKLGYAMQNNQCVAKQEPESNRKAPAPMVSEATQCAKGKYLFDGTCWDCPQGAYCTNGQIQLCPVGTYNEKRGATSQSSCKKCKWETGEGSVICAPPRTKRK